MWKRCLTFIFMLTIITGSAFAKDWVYYGTTTDGLQMFYDATSVQQEKDPRDDRTMDLIWVGLQDPRKGFVDTFYYVGFKNDPLEYAVLGEVQCTRNGDVIEETKYPNAEWDIVENANMMAFLYQQITSQGYTADINSKNEACNVSEERAEIDQAVYTMDNQTRKVVSNEKNYVGNMHTGRFHANGCRWEKQISASNRIYFESRDEVINAGYIPCQTCNP